MCQFFGPWPELSVDGAMPGRAAREGRSALPRSMVIFLLIAGNFAVASFHLLHGTRRWIRDQGWAWLGGYLLFAGTGE